MLDEFDSHADLGVHHADQAVYREAKLAHLHGQHQLGARWERCVYLQIARGGTYIREFATDGRIVGFDLRRMAGQPGFELLAMFMGKIEEAYPGLGAGIFPRHFGGAIDNVIDIGQGELDTHPTTSRDRVWDPDRHSSLAKVEGRNPLPVGPGEERDRKLDRHADVAAPFALHERAGGTKTGPGTVERNRLVEDKVRAERKGTPYRLLAVNHGDGNRAFVAGSGANAAQDLRGYVLVNAVHNYGFESGAGQPAHSRIGIAAGFNPNFEITQYAA